MAVKRAGGGEGAYEWKELVRDAVLVKEDPAKVWETGLADYVGPVEFKTSTVDDPTIISLVASRDIQPGELLIACNAWSTVETNPRNTAPSYEASSYVFDVSAGANHAARGPARRARPGETRVLEGARRGELGAAWIEAWWRAQRRRGIQTSEDFGRACAGRGQDIG